MARIFKAHRPQAPEHGARSTAKPGAPGPKPELKPGAKPDNTAKPPDNTAKPPDNKAKPREIGGPQGPEPTRYGDWERKGICVDF